MSGLFSKSACTLVTLLASTSANATASEDPLRFFAGCLGRASAEWSHAATFSDSLAVSRVEGLRDQLEMLVALLTPEGAGRDVMAIRLESRAAHAALLTRATRADDDWAAARAEALIAECAAQMIVA